MKNHRTIVKRLYAVFLLAFLISGGYLLTGFGPLKTSVELDVKEHPVYQSIKAETLINDTALSFEKAKQTYNGKEVVLSGEINSKRDNNKEIGLSGSEHPDEGKIITCKTSDKRAVSTISSLKTGDRVRVYGKLSFGLVNKAVILDIDSVVPDDDGNKIISDGWSFIDGYMIDGSRSQKRSLDGGKVTYRIPASWAGSEQSIKDNDLGVIDGYQYVLDVKGRSNLRADNVFVCYFSKDLLEHKEDINDTMAVEKAMISNILGEDSDINWFTMETRTTGNGSGEKYSYYRGKYNDSVILSSPYRVEMVFQPVKSEGIILYLYVYDDRDMESDTNVKDIIYVMSQTKVS